MGEQWIIDSEEKLEFYVNELRKQFNDHKYLICDIASGKQRTKLQNSALHLYCKLLADALNDAGLDMKKVLTKKPDIPWTKYSVKEYLWRPIQDAMTGKESTVDQNRIDYNKIHKVLDRHLLEKFSISVEWPVREGDGIRRSLQEPEQNN